MGGWNSWTFAAGLFGSFYTRLRENFHILFSIGPKGLEGYAPKSFDWVVFLVGYMMMCAAVVKIITDSYRRTKTER